MNLSQCLVASFLEIDPPATKIYEKLGYTATPNAALD
jgi:hypothetical protein